MYTNKTSENRSNILSLNWVQTELKQSLQEKAHKVSLQYHKRPLGKIGREVEQNVTKSEPDPDP